MEYHFVLLLIYCRCVQCCANKILSSTLRNVYNVCKSFGILLLKSKGEMFMCLCDLRIRSYFGLFGFCYATIYRIYALGYSSNWYKTDSFQYVRDCS